MPIAFDRFIEAKRGNTIDFCQVAIEFQLRRAARSNSPPQSTRCSGYRQASWSHPHASPHPSRNLGPKSEEHRQYLRVYVTHLRQKIESDPASPSLIKTEPGIGYRFISNEAF